MLRNRTLLLTPGPTPVPPRIAARIAQPVVHHRGEEFRTVWSRVNRGLERLFGTKSPVLTLAASGTGALEASIVNVFSKGDKVLSFSAGKWGERYGEIADAHGLNVVKLTRPYGEEIRAADVRSALSDHPDARGVLVTLCETSTGALNPVESIAAVTRKSQTLLFVDAVSGLACDPLRMDAWGVDVAVSASQKGLMLPPGLGFVALGTRALARLDASDLPKFYFDLKPALDAHRRQTSAFTPAVTLVSGLDEALTMILDEEGLDAAWARHAATASLVRKALGEIGLAFLPSQPSSALTSIRMPEGARSDDLLRIMSEEHGVVMANGQGDLRGRIVRFAHMGDTARPEPAAAGIEAFRASLASLGRALESANAN